MIKLTLILGGIALLASCKEREILAPPASAELQHSESAESTPASSNETKSCCSEHPSPDAVEATENSIYQVDSQWQDQSGKKHQLKSLGGRIQVVTMGYTTCKYACPRLLADMRLIESGLPQEIAAQTGFTFISIDPETDTPARLAEYRKENHLDSARWTVLTGDAESVQELAVVLGIQYRKVGEKDFAHSNLITILDANGEVIHRQKGLEADPQDTIKAIVAASP